MSNDFPSQASFYERYPNQTVAIYTGTSGKWEALHIITTDKDDRWYTSVISIESFKRREIERAFPTKRNDDGSYTCIPIPKGPYYSLKQRWEYEWDKAMWGNLKIDKIDTVIEHTNVWDFYRHIRYDYKKKRYLKDDEECTRGAR